VTKKVSKKEIDAALPITRELVKNDDGRKGYSVSIAMPEMDTLLKLAGFEASSNAKETEDQFKNYYIGGSAGQQYAIIKPPYNQDQLWRLTTENNALLPCIDAYVTNIDGTGYTLMADDAKPDDADNDPELKELWDFFGEVWPGESFQLLRKKVRRDRHTVGNGYFEIIRNLMSEITFMRHVDAKTMRIVALDDPIPVTKTYKRWGEDVPVTSYIRERRFAQITNMGGQVIYFREFGATRHLSKTTGKWEDAANPVALSDRATEIMHFVDIPDATSPYGVPRWITQLPSVLGSRKAEEFNMDFFDNGGIPPALIVLQGGTLAAKTRQALESMMFVKAAKKQRLMVVEAEPNGGSLDNPGNVRVTVERFGTERQNDSMFEKYDDKCEQRVRRSFRLPPIFVGASSDYNFATAYASYTVAEAQVFRPEREDFDEAISIKLIPALKKTKRVYRMRSLPLQIQEASTKIEGVKIARDTGFVSPATVIQSVNEFAGLNLKIEATQTMPQVGQVTEAPGEGGKAPTKDLNSQTGLPNGKVLPSGSK
jgi:PBSX family phage portal protein